MKTSRIILFIVTILVLIGISIYGAVYLNHWRGIFWEDISKKDVSNLWLLIVQFSVAAFVLVYASACQTWLQSKLSLGIRKIYTSRYILKYMQETVQNSKYLSDINVDQRIADDVKILTNNILGLVTGILLSLGTAIIFMCILYDFSSKLFNSPYELPGYTLLYAVLSVSIVFGVGKLLKLVSTVSAVQTAEAVFRTGLIQKIDNDHADRFSMIVEKSKLLFFKQKIINLFLGGYNQASVILPLLFILPIYMSNPEFTFGNLMQVTNCVAEVIASLSYLTNSWTTVLESKTCYNRLKEMNREIENAS